MAKNAGAAKSAANSASDNGKLVEADLAIEREFASEKSATAKAPVAGALDLNAFEKARDALEQQLKFWSLAVEDTSRSWRQFDDQVLGASSELLRLRDVEQDFRRLTATHDDQLKLAEGLRAELAEVKLKEAAANERAAKLEDICEQIKERAVDIHTALQTSRANEQKLQSDLKTLESDLVQVRRSVQEEEAARIAAEEQTTKLRTMVGEMEAVEAEARERLARVTDENRTLSQKVPQLVSDNNSYQKQLSASERENARMQAERRVSSDRINDLEAEIKTLRDDLASLVAPDVAPQEAPKAAEPAPVEQIVELDEMDLVSSLDRAFSGADEPEKPGPDTKH